MRQHQVSTVRDKPIKTRSAGNCENCNIYGYRWSYERSGWLCLACSMNLESGRLKNGSRAPAAPDEKPAT